jgi:hypothetical protein
MDNLRHDEATALTATNTHPRGRVAVAPGPPHPTRLEATGPVGHALNLAVFLVLYLLEPTSDATLLFYGTSMWLAAMRGYAGCEVLAASNWLLHRDDQVGCAVFWPIDQLEHQRPVRRASAAVGYQPLKRNEE